MYFGFIFRPHASSCHKTVDDDRELLVESCFLCPSARVAEHHLPSPWRKPVEAGSFLRGVVVFAGAHTVIYNYDVM